MWIIFSCFPYFPIIHKFSPHFLSLPWFIVRRLNNMMRTICFKSGVDTHHRDIPEDVLNTYCWIHSTYTVVDAFRKKQGLEVPFPGVDNSQGGRGALTIKHTKYYQWVAFTLFFQVSQWFCCIISHITTTFCTYCGCGLRRQRIGCLGHWNDVPGWTGWHLIYCLFELLLSFKGKSQRLSEKLVNGMDTCTVP